MFAIKQRLQAVADQSLRFTLMKLFENIFGNQTLGSAGLAINAGSATTYKMTNASALPYLINGQLFTKAALTAQAIPAAAALTSTNNQAVAVVLALDSTGALTNYTGPVAVSAASVAAAQAAVVYPAVPPNLAVIGVIVIASAATTFTPATTALDAAGITVTYINVTGPFFPIPPL